MGNCILSCCNCCCTQLAKQSNEPDKKRKTVTFEHFFENLEPLDVVWFRGTWPESIFFEGLGQAKFSDGEWSHCALVVTTDLIDIENGDPDRFYLWEATTGDSDTGPDVETKRYTSGVQVRDLVSIIDNYTKFPGTRVGWSRLKLNPLKDKHRFPEISEILSKFKQDHGRAAYDSSINSIAKSIHCNSCCLKCCTCCTKDKNRDSAYFCSEFIARVYQVIRVLPEDLDAETVSPPALNGSDPSFATPLTPFVYVEN